MNTLLSVITLLLASAAAANDAHDIIAQPHIARIVNAVQKAVPSPDIPCKAEVNAVFECLGQPCIDCFVAIIKEFDANTSCESLAEDKDFCPTIEGCVAECAKNDCTAPAKGLEDCAEKSYPDAAANKQSPCPDLCKKPERLTMLESDSQRQGQAAVGFGFRGTSSAISGLKDAIHSSVGSQTLTVRVEKATDLSGEDTLGTSDTYVKVGVYKERWGPDEKIGEQRTRVVNSLNPRFDQDFEFPIPSTKNIVVKLEVLDKDPLSDDEMGEAEIELDDLQLSSTFTPVVKTVDDNWFSTDAKIYVSLKVE